MPKKKIKNNLVFALIIVAIAFLLIEKTPMCCYVEEKKLVEIRDPIEEDITIEKAEIQEKGETYMLVWGSSMYPSIKPGQQCTCMETDQYEKDDIIAFYMYENDHLIFIVHRVIEITPSGVLTKGDNNLMEDPWLVPFDNIFCKIPEKWQWKEVINEKKI